MYYWPGPGSASGYFLEPGPLDKSVGQEDLDRVMSSRRFLKVFGELLALPNEQAEVLLRRELESALAKYKSLFEAYMTEHSDVFDPSVKPTVGPSFRISDHSDQSPTFLGARIKVLSLVLIAGNLKLEGLQPVTTAVLKQALQQRELFSSRDAVNERAGYGMLCRGSLYNRQILATGLIGTASDVNKENAGIENLEIVWKSKKLTHYDAAATPYDLLTRVVGVFPVDYSKGELLVQYLGPLTDAEFDKISNEVGGSTHD